MFANIGLKVFKRVFVSFFSLKLDNMNKFYKLCLVLIFDRYWPDYNF